MNKFEQQVATIMAFGQELKAKPTSWLTRNNDEESLTEGEVKALEESITQRINRRLI